MQSFDTQAGLESLGEMASGLRLSALPGSERLIMQPPEVWIARYEALRESCEKKARSQGQVQTGVFYTPSWIARYLTQQTLGNILTRFLADIQDAIRQAQPTRALALLSEAKTYKVIDPACGTGVFLVEALRQWHDFYQQVNVLFPAPVVEHPAAYSLQHQLYGVDIDLLSVILTEFRLVQWVYQLDGTIAQEHLAGLQTHVVCGDALAELQFDPDSRWHVVLGNPPYISETRKQAQRFRALHAQEPLYYQAKMDLCDAFLAWAINHLHADGQLGFVLPEYWTQRSSTRLLREHLWQQGAIREFWQLGGPRVFKNAPGHHSSLLIWQKNTQPVPSVSEYQVAAGVATDETELTPQRLQPMLWALDSTSGKLRYGNSVESSLLQRLSGLPPLLTKDEIQQGVVMPQGRLKKNDWERLPLPIQQLVSHPCGVFLLTDSEVAALNLTEPERLLLKPYYGPAGFQAFFGFHSEAPIYQLIYGNLENRKRVEMYPEHYQQLRAHLDRFQSINTSAFAPYGLHRARQPEWFESANRILCPRQVLRPSCAVVDFPAYVNEGFYILRPVDVDPHYTCGLLNSKLAWFWFYKYKRKGDRLQIDKDVLSVFPAPTPISNNQQIQVAKLARQLSTEPDNASLLEALNEAVFQLYQLTAEEVTLVEDAYQSIVGI